MSHDMTKAELVRCRMWQEVENQKLRLQVRRLKEELARTPGQLLFPERKDARA